MTLVTAIPVGCRTPRRVEVGSLNPGDRLILGDSKLSVRVDSIEFLVEEGFWRVSGDAGWEVVHVMEDGTILEMP